MLSNGWLVSVRCGHFVVDVFTFVRQLSKRRISHQSHTHTYTHTHTHTHKWVVRLLSSMLCCMMWMEVSPFKRPSRTLKVWKQSISDKVYALWCNNTAFHTNGSFCYKQWHTQTNKSGTQTNSDTQTNSGKYHTSTHSTWQIAFIVHVIFDYYYCYYYYYY